MYRHITQTIIDAHWFNVIETIRWWWIDCGCNPNKVTEIQATQFVLDNGIDECPQIHLPESSNDQQNMQQRPSHRSTSNQPKLAGGKQCAKYFDESGNKKMNNLIGTQL